MIKKTINSKFNKIIFAGSILLNVILILLMSHDFFYTRNDSLNIDTTSLIYKEECLKKSSSVDWQSMPVFEKIFIEKNDSLFNIVLNESYENDPQFAFLFVSTYYLIKQDYKRKKDLKAICSKIESIYGKAPSIHFFN